MFKSTPTPAPITILSGEAVTFLFSLIYFWNPASDRKVSGGLFFNKNCVFLECDGVGFGADFLSSHVSGGKRCL